MFLDNIPSAKLSILKKSLIKFMPTPKIKFEGFVFFWNSNSTDLSILKPYSIFLLIILKLNLNMKIKDLKLECLVYIIQK